MPTSFFGLFLFSTALALVATFVAVGVQSLLRLAGVGKNEPPRLR